MEPKIHVYVFSSMKSLTINNNCFHSLIIKHLYLHKELINLAKLLHLIPAAAQNVDLRIAVW